MIELPKDAPGKVACGRSGLPLLARCTCGHEHLIAWRLLKTHDEDETPLYGRRFKCKACGRGNQATLFALETETELTAIRLEQERLAPPKSAAELLGHVTAQGSRG